MASIERGASVVVSSPPNSGARSPSTREKSALCCEYRSAFSTVWARESAGISPSRVTGGVYSRLPTAQCEFTQSAAVGFAPAREIVVDVRRRRELAGTVKALLRGFEAFARDRHDGIRCVAEKIGQHAALVT